MNTTTIPAAVVRELRGALYHRIGSFGEDIASINHEPTNAEQLLEWSEPIAVFNRFCALLGRIGWIAREPEQNAAVDLDRYRWTLTHVLGSDRDLARSIATEHTSTTTEDERKQAAERASAIESFAASVGLELGNEGERYVTVPEDFADVLFESLIGELRQAGAAIETAPDRDALEHFDSIRELLDAIGWGSGERIDLDLYGDALRQVLANRLSLERYMLADAAESVEKGHKGAEQARERAYAYALEIERFLHEAGLPIPPEGGESDA
jgi:hypothetical protein